MHVFKIEQRIQYDIIGLAQFTPLHFLTIVVFSQPKPLVSVAPLTIYLPLALPKLTYKLGFSAYLPLALPKLTYKLRFSATFVCQ